MDLENLINALREGAPVHKLSDGREVILSPNGFSVKDLTEVKPIPSRIQANRAFHDGDSLARYAKKYKTPDSLLVADITHPVIWVLLDYHGENTPAAVDHNAQWRVQYSDPYDEWNAFSGQLHDQSEFVAFLEENVMDLVTPEPAKMLELAKDFSANKTVNFKSGHRLDNGDRSLTYVEETGTKGAIEIPKKIKIKIPIYNREDEVEIELWFRYRINDGLLKLGFDFHRIEPIKQAAFNAAVDRVAAESGLDAFFGGV